MPGMENFKLDDILIPWFTVVLFVVCINWTKDQYKTVHDHD